ncbi:hypothetical protein [Brevundimonas naejangsanensis]|uniref:hypothetical protein n=1 Tax=Brevundimonas naejangsanensis TaxID=588932 RepID=UPI0026E9F4C7|nr:hypothetical protein [Brevundimonas naejangsanensis]
MIEQNNLNRSDLIESISKETIWNRGEVAAILDGKELPSYTCIDSFAKNLKVSSVDFYLVLELAKDVPGAQENLERFINRTNRQINIKPLHIY